jgi:hypothetical protein
MNLVNLASAIALIRRHEPGKSPYALVNYLRGFTKPAYTTKFWTIATGVNQGFLQGDLDGTIPLAGEPTDFGHLIAALSDQLDPPDLKTLTAWTGDHTSWAGDLGSTIVTWGRNPEKFIDLSDALNRFASDSDQAANIAAYLIGVELNSTGGSLSAIVATYNAKPFNQHVQRFVQLRFGPGDPAPEIRKQIVTYLRLASDSGLYGWLQGALKGKLFPRKGYGDGEIDRARDYFVSYLQRRST